MSVFGGVIGAISGGIIGGFTANSNAKKQAAAQKDLALAQQQYAKDIMEGAKEYSGKAAYSKLANAADQEAAATNWGSLMSGASMAPSNNSSAMSNAANLNNNYMQGYNLGRANQEKMLNAAFDSKIAGSKNMVESAKQRAKQAGVNAKVSNATVQGGLNTGAGLLKTYNQLKPSSGGD